MTNSLHFKLVLFAFGSILFALVIAGVSIDYLLANLYGEKAEHEAEHAYELIYNEIKSVEKNTADQSQIIAMDSDVVDVVSLVNRYQDIKNYQPLIFDNEKKKLSVFLSKKINSYHNAKAAVYNNNGELIAFSIRHDLDTISGITTYDKAGVVYLSKGMKSKAWKSVSLSSQIPSKISMHTNWDTFVSRSGRIDYFSNKNNFTVESMRSIQRESPDGTSEPIGFIKITVVFDRHYIKKLSGISHVKASLVLANGVIINKPDNLNSIFGLEDSSVLFGSKQVSRKIWVDHNVYYIHSYVLPVFNGKIYFLISQPKSDLKIALNRSRYSLFIIFLITAFIVISLGVFWLNRHVSNPLKILTNQLNNIKGNKYPNFYESKSKDEISLLGNGLNKMVKVIRNREEDLKKSQIDLNEAQRLSKIGSWSMDKNRNKFYWSDEIYNIFGLNSGEVEPSYDFFMEMVFPDDRSIVKDKYIESLKYHRPYDITHRLQMKDGAIKYIHQHCESVFNEQGVALYSKGTIQDITEKKHKDEMLNRSQKMDAIGKLTGGIAHDFNNMLGVMLGYSELLQSALNGDEKKVKYINEILAAGERARVLTRKLLAFSRKEATTTELTNINKLLMEEKNLLEKTLTARIRLTCDFEEGLWPVMLDKSDIQNAVLNMCINSMHAMPNIGNLTIKTENVHLDYDDVINMQLESGDYVLVSITDTGTGMDEEVRSKLFDPFFSTKGEQGTGLGMSQVYGFVKQTGGAISVYSEPGYGTRIAIYLPRSIEENDSTGQQSDEVSEIPETGNETILIVDDVVSLRDLAAEILTGHGYKTLVAESGFEALDILKSESVDLMLSDIIMPEMDGYQLAEKVQELYPDIEIQMASGFSDDRLLTASNEELYNNRLQKPFTSKALLQSIRKLLDKKKLKDVLVEDSVLDELHGFIQWSSKYSSGIDEIDADHKVLVRLINRCQKAVIDNQQDEKIISILGDLISYVDYHFAREELIMETCDCPDLEMHKDLHKNMSLQVGSYVKEYGRGKLTAKSLLEFLMSWLINHIQEEDLPMAQFCSGKEEMIHQAFNNAENSSKLKEDIN